MGLIMQGFFFAQVMTHYKCCNPSLGLATKAKGCKVAGQKKDLAVTSHAHGSAKNARE